MTATWQFRFAPAPELPALAWLARIRPGSLDIHYGKSVRRREDSAFFEGTWVGPQSLASVPRSTTVFGSGIVASDGELIVVTPSHHLEGVYVARAASHLIVSNSLVGTLSAANLKLDPDADYPSIFAAASALCWYIDDVSEDPSGRLVGTRVSIPTRTDTVTSHYFENLLIGPDLSVTEARKRREEPFESFADYSRRLTNALDSAISNAGSYEPVVSLSSGYDSTAVAAVAVRVGCRRAVGFATSRPSPHDGSIDDSGVAAAALLGLGYEVADRLAYRNSNDLPEAEFLASGMVGEDIIFQAHESGIHRTSLLTGYWGGTQFAMSRSDDWRHVAPTTTAGASLTEFRLRNDFYHLPVPIFAAAQEAGAPRLLDRREMAPFRIGGHYDRPIPRRLAEEAGIPRGSFAVAKRAANVLFQHDGPEAFSDASRASLEEFAAREGRRVDFRRRSQIQRRHRATIAGARRLNLGLFTRGLERRRASLVHFERAFGTLVFRWAVSVIRPRYRAVERFRQ